VGGLSSSRGFDYEGFIRELREMVQELEEEKKKLADKYRRFYLHIVKTLLKHGVNNVIAAGMFGAVDKTLEVGIVIEDNTVYYLDAERDIRVILETEEDVLTAIDVIYGDLLLMLSPRYMVEILKKQFEKLARGENALASFLPRRSREYPEIP